MLRNSKVHYKSSELYPILSMHFGESMNLARIKAMSLVICALCKVQRLAYTKLASAFDTEATAGSSLRRSQRLIAECEIYKDLIAKLILKPIPVKGHYNLAMCSTDHLWEKTGSRKSDVNTKRSFFLLSWECRFVLNHLPMSSNSINQ